MEQLHAWHEQDAQRRRANVIRDGEESELGWTPLQDERTTAGTVIVRLMGNRAFLEKVTLRVVAGGPTPPTQTKVQYASSAGRHTIPASRPSDGI